MIQPFDWKVGKKAKGLEQKKSFTEEDRKVIQEKIKKQNRIDLILNIAKAVVVVSILLFIYWYVVLNGWKH